MLTKESLTIKRFLDKQPRGKGSLEYRKLYNFLEKKEVYDIHVKEYEEQLMNQQYIKIDSTFVSKNITSSSKFKKQQNITFSVHNTNVTLLIYSNEDTSTFINEVMNVIRYTICLFDTPRKNITIQYYLLDAEKKIQKNKSYVFIGRNEINSGSCQHQFGGNCKISIWRKEEVIKVTIHELIHGLTSYPIEDTDNIIKHYQNKYNIISPKINTDETFTEVWANIINVYLLSQKKSHTNFKLFNELLVTEKKFCEYQSQKVASITQLLQRNTDINQETNVLAYYIIRCEIFSRLPQFLKMCRENNKGYVHMKNQRIWFAFLKKIGNIKVNYKVSKSKLISTTMRMSSIEPKVFTDE
jgi:hypothetical protein